MDRIDSATAQAIWQQLIAQVLQREQIELAQICFDGTNFYTFIDISTSSAPRQTRQEQAGPRQSATGQLCALLLQRRATALFYEVYEGNRNDAKEFPQVLEKFQRWLVQRTGSTWATIKPTLIFDKATTPRTTSP